MADAPPPRCPICGRPPQAKTQPFCSARCARIDLGRWLTGDYAIPAEPARDEDEEGCD